ncbi:MAG: M3 family metallopeptidase [Simkaniaceae bacterium]|nr:M3 family metallopeptidase [Simkaniaceae bacterium]
MSSESNQDSANPLLCFNKLPAFDKIEVKHIKPAIEKILTELEPQLQRLEALKSPTWESLISPLEHIEDKLHKVVGPIKHLQSVNDSKELRDAWIAIEPLIINFDLRIMQSKSLYNHMLELEKNAAFESYAPAQKRILKKIIQAAKLSGIALDNPSQLRFNQIENKLAELQTAFSQNVLDATKNFSLIIEDPDLIEGLPENILFITSKTFKDTHPNKETTETTGPWQLTLSPPIFIAVMKHCKSQAIREKLYRAFITRASSGNLDNSENLKEQIRLKKEKAELLGFSNFAELSMQTKMAPSVESIMQLLEELRTAAWVGAKNDLQEIEDIAKTLGHIGPIKHWDMGYFAERLKESRFEFTEEELRPYFQLPKVLEGLFDLSYKLFGITVELSMENAPTWHPDVSYYVIKNQEGQQIASFYLDPYSRPENKRGGAWMDSCADRMILDGEVQLPIAYVICNGTPPTNTEPSLMSFREVETLFHEFGHALQHMMTKIDYKNAAGINGVEWDAVELPSQFMENWCYYKPTLIGMTEHIKTKNPLPDALFAKIVASRTFQAGSGMLRQIQFAMTDLELFHTYDPNQSNKTPFDVMQEIAKKTSIMPPLLEERFLCAFTHIFAGDYSAGYYSYKWAEVLSADAFSAFEEAGLDNPQAIAETGERFLKTILELGGSVHPMEVFVQFRERPPQVDALLRHSGLK